jgi:hypothetical protein
MGDEREETIEEEIERKLAKLSKTTFAYRSSS